jgi:hypothetical protein
MKRALLVAAALTLGSTAALAQDPVPSFKDYVDLPKITVTSDRTVEQSFEKTQIRQAVIPAPSFAG